MPWPVDIVISVECQKIYNQVFLLLLQIKWAKYSLDVLRFHGKDINGLFPFFITENVMLKLRVPQVCYF